MVVNRNYKHVEPISIKYLADIEPIKAAHANEWIDLRCAEETVIKKGEFKLIPLGVAMQLPKGYEAIIAPRSSTFKKYHIIQTNSIGVIDSSYCGDDDEWKMAVYAVEDTIIHKNDRICQFRIQRVNPEIVFIEVDYLGNESRGGFGSTGVN